MKHLVLKLVWVVSVLWVVRANCLTKNFIHYLTFNNNFCPVLFVSEETSKMCIDENAVSREILLRGYLEPGYTRRMDGGNKTLKQWPLAWFGFHTGFPGKVQTDPPPPHRFSEMPL